MPPPPILLFFCLCALALMFASCDSSGGDGSDLADGTNTEQTTDTESGTSGDSSSDESNTGGGNEGDDSTDNTGGSGGQGGSEQESGDGDNNNNDDTTEVEQTSFPVSTEAVGLGGWNTWKTCTLTFTLTSEASVTIGVEGTLAWSSYCQLDDATLYLDNTSDNLLSNGDFESSTYDQSSDWTAPTDWDVSVGSNEKGWGDYGVETDSGNNYLNLSNYDDKEGNTSKNDLPATATQTVTLQPGSYTAIIKVAGKDEGNTSSSFAFTAYLAE